jgi:hypothetical protein
MHKKRRALFVTDTTGWKPISIATQPTTAPGMRLFGDTSNHGRELR